MDNSKRRILNKINLSTYLGLLIAKIFGGQTVKLDNGLYMNYGRKGKYQKADVVTVGDVFLVKFDKDCIHCQQRNLYILSDNLLRHETKHSEQYAILGLFFIPLYILASIKSYIIYRNFWQGNIFEIRAGLEDGNYI
jgi:hypothetical protein